VVNYTLFLVLIGTGLIGTVAGALGVFALLKGYSLLGDTISHAALPGIALAFLYTQSKNPLILLIGGALASGIGTVLILIIRRTTTLAHDAILGIILSCFFGAGLMLLTHIQKCHPAHQSIITKFLFGSAATLLPTDIYCIAILATLCITVLILFWKEFTILTFDPCLGYSCGYPMLMLEILLTSLLVIAIMIGLQAVGAILMSSLLIAPAAAARQWTTHLSTMVMLSALIGAFSAIAGSIISSHYEHIPTGPAITLVASALVIISLIHARRTPKKTLGSV